MFKPERNLISITCYHCGEGTFLIPIDQKDSKKCDECSIEQELDLQSDQLNEGFIFIHRSKFREPPLIIATRVNMPSVVKAFVDSRINVNITWNGQSPMGWAADNNLDTLKFLISQGGIMDNYPPGTYSPLYAACQAGNIDTVTYLLENNIDVNETIGLSTTFCPLGVAVEFENIEIIKILSEYNLSEESIEMATNIAQGRSYRNSDQRNETIDLLLEYIQLKKKGF